MRLTQDERAIIEDMICAWESLDADTFWWNYGSEQASQQLPWKDDPDRALYLFDVAQRAVQLRRVRGVRMVAD